MDFKKIELHNVDFEKLIKVIEKCTGDVYLETTDGDSLNLKSRLCQILGLSTILTSTEIADAWVRCANQDDETMIFRFNLYGEMPE